MNTWAQVLSSEELPEQIILPSSAIEEDEDSVIVPEELPILALRNTVLFPEVMLPITVGREASIKLVRQVAKENNLVGVISQRERKMDEPEPRDLYEVGTVAKILKLLKMPDGSKSIIIQGKKRFKVEEFTQSKPYFKARIEVLGEEGGIDNDVEERALMHSIKESACEMVNLSPNLPNEAIEAIENIDSIPFLIHFIASNLQIDVQEKQLLLETVSLGERGRLLIEHLNKEIQILQLSDELRSRMKSDVNQQQREFFLRQQMKIIQSELGEGNESNEHDALRERAEEKQLPDHVTKTFEKEMKKLERTNPSLPDYAVTRNYIDWILDLPWTEFTEDQLDIERAEKILDEDHHGLEKVKKRIIEYLAVLKLKGDMKAPILCFYGPPGVGKTSLGKSIARALDRQFVRMSLGGVHDEAEIRGHRRTYIGALPGRILQGLLLCLRDPAVQQMSLIDDLLQPFCTGDRKAIEISSACSDYLLENDGEDLVLLLDGFDEYPETMRKNGLIASLLKHRVLPCCGLIISSRPHASVSLRDQATVRVDILGFTEAEREHYITQSMKGQPQKVDELTRYLQVHSTISSLCFIPFNLVVLVYLYKQGIPLPQNSAQLYNYFIYLTICRHLKKHAHHLQGNITELTKLPNLTDLPEPYNKIIQQLSKLSLEALNDDKLIFTLDEIKAACPDITAIPGAIKGFGLLQAVEHFGLTGTTTTFNFLHFSLQEYLAAHHIANLPADEELRIIKEKFWSKLHFNMFSIYISLTKGQRRSFKHFLCGGNEAIAISDKFLKDQLQCFQLYRCFHEAGDDDICKIIERSVKFSDKKIDLSGTILTASDVENVTVFLTSSSHKEWVWLDLDYRYIQDHGLHILHRGLLHCSDVTITTLELPNNGLTMHIYR